MRFSFNNPSITTELLINKTLADTKYPDVSVLKLSGLNFLKFNILTPSCLPVDEMNAIPTKIICQ